MAPFRITDNPYYVGSEDVASYLVVTPKGNILINAKARVNRYRVAAFSVFNAARPASL